MINKNVKYPAMRILFGFTFVGLLGGVSSFIPLFAEIFKTADFSEALYLLFFVSISGLILGFMPALLIGLYCIYFKVYLQTWLDYLYFIAVSFVIIFSYLIVFNEFLFKNPLSSWQLIDAFYIGLFGSILSMICGKLFLPKLKDLNDDYDLEGNL